MRLKASINGATDYLIIYPKANTNVLIGSLTGKFDDLCVLKVDEVDKIVFNENGLNVTIDATTGKVSVGNATTSLFALLNMLTALLKQFQVYTPVGPSGVPIATTMALINQFETAFKSLLN